jgi:uncharacterized protein YecT (DUF1311 family)
MLTTLILSVALATTLPGSGDEREPDSVGMSEILSSCVDSKPTQTARYACIGLHAERCLVRTESQTTIGMETCYGAEFRGWDVLLNRAYRELGGQRREELREVQRAWLSYRDKACRYYAVHYQGGSVARWMGARCMMEETARRAIALHFFAADAR